MVLAFLVVSLALGACGFGWWAAGQIDDASIEKQQRAVAVGLEEISARVPVEQDSSAIWDDSVVNLRTGDESWISENLAEWMSEYFGHDKVFILDSRNNPVRAVQSGRAINADRYEEDRAVLGPLVQKLRLEMAEASRGEADSTASVTGLGVMDTVTLRGGEVGVVSIRPIVPSTANVHQSPGTEYLHISVLLLGPAVSTQIADKFALTQLRFSPAAKVSAGEVSRPVLDGAGRIQGFFSWLPDRPARALLQRVAPVGLPVILLVIVSVIALFARLRRTASLLNESRGNAEFLAFHDAMTGLPNRALFSDRLKLALANWRVAKARFALHVVDLDRFKHVNDSLGHPMGDELIRQVSSRLSGLVSEVDTAARIGGDEFAIIQHGVSDVNSALTLSQRIVSDLQRPFDLSGHEVLVGASVGVSLSDEGTIGAEDMFRQADVALYEAKTSGRGRYQLFAGDLDLAVQERRALELELRSALNGSPGLDVVYQPIYSADGQSILGAEALSRWLSPTRGTVSPAVFIPLAEERGLIDQLGFWVLRRACRFALQSPLPWVAVNVSPLQFRTERFAEQVLKILEEVGLPPRRLEIEVTEGLLLQSSPVVQETLRVLRAAGVRVALDDFGTGYSSISYLRTYGVDKLKIDQSFTAKLGIDPEIDHIVRCIIGLASAMHMKVTAEGVETAAQAKMLREMGCDQLQGFLLSRPIAAEALIALMKGAPEQVLKMVS